ncbi:MAG TPA: hypothetical protein VGS27_22000 [Candidatus Sulfotelmatobacter sp.]|nr:hypothetical protein [Candidatus Sulfotelmatobacter sp.]
MLRNPAAIGELEEVDARISGAVEIGGIEAVSLGLRRRGRTEISVIRGETR